MASRIRSFRMHFSIVANQADDAQSGSCLAQGAVLKSVHLGFTPGKKRKFAFSVEEIDESDYLYL
jgi:hypothetical protein